MKIVRDKWKTPFTIIQMKIKDRVRGIGFTRRRLRTRSLIIESMLCNMYDRFIMKGDKKYCPICENFLTIFLPMGEKLRPNAKCPNCGSLERHRLIYLYFKEETNIFKDSIRLLHFAPELCFVEMFSRQSNIEYFPVDIDQSSPFIRERVDIQNAQYPDNFFDAIYCSHVLEHVPDDKKAMRELYRILKISGWAILQVPINVNSNNTIEDPRINTPEKRSQFYEQKDHLRYYGLDYPQRLKEAGFKVKVDKFLLKFDNRARKRYGLPKTEDIYFCTK
jgi:SAM-dependent methyltransferase